MPEWLQQSFETDAELSTGLLVPRLAASLLLGCVVAAIYRLTHGRHAGQASGLVATLVLLTVLIAMMTLVIGNNVARAFSLVGALAIVRFRTVVEDTRDTAFVIFAVGVGMAVGAGFFRVPLVGIPFAAAAAFLFRPRIVDASALPSEWVLTVRVGSAFADEALLRGVFSAHLASWRPTAVSTARQGAAFEKAYTARLRDENGAAALASALNGVEGVQGVEVRRG